MPHALIAGVPPEWSQQVKAASKKVQLDGWSYSVFPGLRPKVPGLELSQMTALFEEAAVRGGAHVFAVLEGRESGSVAEAVREHFRFRWIAAHFVREATNSLAPLVEELQRATQEEIEWRHSMHPIRKSSPLALPRCGFRASRSVENIWATCESFNKQVGYFPKLSAQLRRFEEEHHKNWDRHQGKFFIDSDRRVWKDDGPYHGDAPFPRDWKYSSVLPEGFHFDVQHEQWKGFDYHDRVGKKKSVAATRHCNVDAHGYLR
jgi:hypothetical protein